MNKKAILVVSFGTSYESTREMTIDVIESEIQQAFPEYKIYRAWTSKMILAKLKKRDGIHYDSVTEAFIRMQTDGIRAVIVQPTHVLNGIENERMKQDAKAFIHDFSSISFGDPLLTTAEDNEILIDAIKEEFHTLPDDMALILMGHGTSHYSNPIYAALDYMFKDKNCDNIFVGTIEAYPSIEQVLRFIEKRKPKKILLAPFMIVAGEHARNDLAGAEGNSWKSIFERSGYEVECILKGLGEYPAVRKLFITHILKADV